MSTSQCGNICVRRGFSNRSPGRSGVFLGESKSTLFGRIIKLTYNRTATHFMDDSFMNLGEKVILTLLWQSESATVYFVNSLRVCYWLFKCRVLHVVCVSVCVCEREREEKRSSHHSEVYSASEIILIAACLQTHTSFITVSVTWFCSPFGLELMVKLRTLLTVLTVILKAEARDYEMGVTFLMQLVVFGQSQCTVPVGQWEQTAFVERRDFVEKRSVWERRGIEELQ